MHPPCTPTLVTFPQVDVGRMPIARQLWVVVPKSTSGATLLYPYSVSYPPLALGCNPCCTPSVGTRPPLEVGCIPTAPPRWVPSTECILGASQVWAFVPLRTQGAFLLLPNFGYLPLSAPRMHPCCSAFLGTCPQMDPRCIPCSTPAMGTRPLMHPGCIPIAPQHWVRSPRVDLECIPIAPLR